MERMITGVEAWDLRVGYVIIGINGNTQTVELTAKRRADDDGSFVIDVLFTDQTSCTYAASDLIDFAHPQPAVY